MANKTIEQMTEEITGKNSSYNTDNNGYSGVHVGKVVPSSGRTAIVYQTEGSNWNRGAPSSSGISYFQGTRAYNGTTDVVVKSHQQWRSGSNYHDDCPGNCYCIESFIDLDGSKYELVLSNRYGEQKMEVDFEKKEVKYKS